MSVNTVGNNEDEALLLLLLPRSLASDVGSYTGTCELFELLSWQGVKLFSFYVNSFVKKGYHFRKTYIGKEGKCILTKKLPISAAAMLFTENLLRILNKNRLKRAILKISRISERRHHYI